MNSLKKQIIQTIAGATTVEGLTRNSVIILTAAGVISGQLCTEPPADQISRPQDVIPALVKSVAANNAPDAVHGNDGALVLEQVSIRNASGQTVKVNSLAVFYDQIIGITLGSIG